MLDRKINKKGFTLVELLVVLVIIAILAAVATPLYLRHTRRARASEAVATMSLIRQAERDQFINTNLFVEITENNLPEQLPPIGFGLDIDLGTPQYFCNNAYLVLLGAAGTSGDSGRFDAPGPSAVDFIIRVDPSLCSETCSSTGFDTTCAVKANQVNGSGSATTPTLLEMDNSGRIFVKYTDDGDGGTNEWEAY